MPAGFPQRLRAPFTLLILLLLVAAAPVGAQPASEVMLDSSPELFTLLCALRAADVAPPVSSPVGALVDRHLRRLDPAVTAPLREFFQERTARAEVDLTAYLSLGLLLGPPPDFTISVPREQIPPDAWELQALVPLLAGFARQAHIKALHQQALPYYEQAIVARQREVAEELLRARAYLRLIGESELARGYMIYLEWLVPPGLSNARSYGVDYFLVLHPEHPDFLQVVRHQYLHFLLDPLALKYATNLGPLGRLQALAERAPRLPREFRRDTLLLATESLVQAVELRLEKPAPAALAARLDEIERSGYVFVRHFYDALQGFEQDEPSIRFYFPELVHGYDEEEEFRRLARVQFLPPRERPAPAPPLAVAPATLWLAEAEDEMKAGNYDAAEALFQQVLQEANPEHPGALYGLALLASLRQDGEAAKRYFLQTLESARQPHILGWTHVYLGRIYDLEGSREQAVQHYRAALALNTRLERVEQAARQGLQQPFGGLDNPERE